MLKHPLVRASAACLVLLASRPTCAAELQLLGEDRGSAWFAPKLITNTQPMCAAALEAERETFFNPLDQSPKVAGLVEITTENAVIADPDVEMLSERALELALTLRDRTRAFVYFFGYPGCGGGCEGGAVGIDDKRIDGGAYESTQESLDLPRGLPRADRYGPNRWRVFKSVDGDFYFRATFEDHTQWYRVASKRSFELACDIALKPTSSGLRAVYSPEVTGAIESLRIAADRMAGGAGGWCGSMQTPSRWMERRKDSLEAALYRPWAVVEVKRREYESANSGGDYARIIDQLELWSLGGATEYRDFAAYKSQFARTAAIVAEFYRKMSGWSAPRAQAMADAALKGAISSGFGFYEYDPYPGPGEQQLRRALLSKAPMDQIRSLDFDAKAIDREGFDSVLDVAIEYPEALSYLLEKGFDPNIGNAFGKTPLMYAAQYNQLTSAEILLKAGADPNATTHDPNDSCAYMIETTSVTPLHYATRYSSARLTQLLLDNGALPFVRSTGSNGGFPRDQLQRYAGVGVVDERNPHIAEAEVAVLMQLLDLPSAAEKAAVATDLVARARSEYAQGNATKAYQHLQLALLISPDRPEALADLPLIALRANRVGAAISAADQATRVLTSPAALAASWFNKGLICADPRAKDAHTVDGARCAPDQVEPFVKSWKLQSSPARGNKLRALIRESEASCAVAGRHYRLAYKDYHTSFRIYVLHRPGEQIDVSKIRWPPAPWVVAGAKVVETFRVGDDAVTLLEVPVRGDRQKVGLVIEGEECEREL